MSILHILNARGCDACRLDQLERTLQHPKLPPSGAAHPDIYILGDNPGLKEDTEGQHFCGSGGDLIRRHLWQQGIQNLRWGNIVRCHTANILPHDIESCGSLTEDDLKAHTPKVLLLAGNAALKWAVEGEKSKSIGDWRGLSIPMQVGTNRFWAVPVYPPLSVVRAGSSFESPMRSLFIRDLELAITLTNQPPPPAPVDFKNTRFVDPRPENLIKLLAQPTLGLDIETTGLDPHHTEARILSAAFYSPNICVAFPVEHPEGPSQLSILSYILSTYRGKIIAHHLAFELSWLFQWIGMQILHQKEWHDSMCGLRRVLSRQTPLGLDDGCRIILGSRPKEVTRFDPVAWEGQPVKKLLYYNAIDARATYELGTRLNLFQWNDLEYKRLREVTITTSIMTHRGVPIHVPKLKELTQTYDQKISELKHHIAEHSLVKAFERATGVSFNPGSHPQVKQLLGVPNGTEEALLQCKHPLVPQIIEFHRISKLHSTYLVGWESLLKGSLLRPRYKVCHVITGRLSSEQPNIQNIPKRRDKWIREPVCPGPGYGILSLDYSQAELRMVAALSKDKTLIQDLWSGADLHSHWADRILELYPPIQDRLKKIYETDDPKRLYKALRDEVKRGITFALPYGSSELNPGIVLSIPEQTSKRISSEFWTRYPGLHQWQENQRRHYRQTGVIIMPTTGRERIALVSGNEPINNPVQGSTSDIVVAAMTRLAKKAFREEDVHLIPILNVHDDLTFIVPDGAESEYALKIAEEMVRLVHPLLEVVPYVVEASYGTDWYHQRVIGEYSSVQFGHRRPRGTTPISEVSPDNFLGSDWACSDHFFVGTTDQKSLETSRLPVHGTVRRR